VAGLVIGALIGFESSLEVQNLVCGDGCSATGNFEYFMITVGACGGGLLGLYMSASFLR